ncbi:MAG: hypothetical protein ACRDRH_11720 [Pseudonocardia sp.]
MNASAAMQRENERGLQTVDGKHTDDGDPCTLPAGVSHLLVADEALCPGRWGSSHVTVCGEEIPTPGATAADPTVDDPKYCPQCVRAAVRWSARSAAR